MNRGFISSFHVVIFLCAILTSSLGLAASKEEIDANVASSLNIFYENYPAGQALANQAVGMLVFQQVLKAGFGVGGEYGEGSLLIDGSPIAYYSTASVSIGFQIGAQVKSQVILFMNNEALENFRNSDSWEAGVDGSVALVEFGAGGEISSNTVQSPIIGFIFSNKGLMYNLTFEGSKLTQIER